jgi:hypothetical protein
MKLKTVLAPATPNFTPQCNLQNSSNEWWESANVALAAPAERLQDCKSASLQAIHLMWQVVYVCPRNQRQRVELHAFLNRVRCNGRFACTANDGYVVLAIGQPCVPAC